jgi:tRNA pseudouridine55 synthase
LEVTGENGEVISEGVLTSNEVPKATIEKSPTPTTKGPPAIRLRMTVTSGFYVRSLCHDLGAAVGSAALMAELERTRQGEFELGKNVLEYDDLEKGEQVWAPKVEAMLDEWYEKDARRPRSERIVERGSIREKRNTSSPEPQEKRKSSPRANDRDRRGSDRGERNERVHSRGDNYKPNSGRRQRERSPERGEKGRLSPQTELSFGER